MGYRLARAPALAVEYLSAISIAAGRVEQLTTPRSSQTGIDSPACSRGRRWLADRHPGSHPRAADAYRTSKTPSALRIRLHSKRNTACAIGGWLPPRRADHRPRRAAQSLAIAATAANVGCCLRQSLDQPARSTRCSDARGVESNRCAVRRFPAAGDDRARRGAAPALARGVVDASAVGPSRTRRAGFESRADWPRPSCRSPPRRLRIGPARRRDAYLIGTTLLSPEGGRLAHGQHSGGVQLNQQRRDSCSASTPTDGDDPPTSSGDRTASGPPRPRPARPLRVARAVPMVEAMACLCWRIITPAARSMRIRRVSFRKPRRLSEDRRGCEDAHS